MQQDDVLDCIEVSGVPPLSISFLRRITSLVVLLKV